MNYKVSLLTTCIAALIVLSGCNKGYVKKGTMAPPNRNASLIEQARAANEGQYTVEYTNINKDTVALIDDVPIGAIIAHFGPWQFSDKWQICMGQEIRDPESPLCGRKVPDLNGAQSPFQTTYVAGTLDSQTYNKRFGSNVMQKEGSHNHGGRTGGSAGRGSDNDNDFRAALGGHSHSINAQGAHDHGGDNRPITYGLVYLIRVK